MKNALRLREIVNAEGTKDTACDTQ
jgi:hypothetical protein